MRISNVFRVKFLVLVITVFFSVQSQAQVPGNVTAPTLKLWLKANAGVTKTLPVTAWADQGGGQPNAVKVGTAPNLISNGLNFNPVLRFDNAGYLRITGGILGANSYSDT
ncbi:MAG: hypothetical protein ACJA08_000089 [Cyclobacteriaceae bacterium]